MKSTATDATTIARDLFARLEQAWNSADGEAYGEPFTDDADGEPFTDDADFVDITGAHHKGRISIGEGHERILDTIYRGSEVRYEVQSARELTAGWLLAHVSATLNSPSGPLEGVHDSTISAVITQVGPDWRIAALHNTLIMQR